MKIKNIIIYIILLQSISCTKGAPNNTQIKNNSVNKSIKEIILLYDKEKFDDIADQYCKDKIIIRGSLDQDGDFYVLNKFEKSNYIKKLLTSDFMIGNNKISNYKKLYSAGELDLDVIENNKIRWNDIIFEYDKKSQKYVITEFYLDSYQLGR